MLDDGATKTWVISFGPFRVTKARRLVERGDEPIHVGGRAFDILVHLLERHGQVVSQRTLMDAAWPGVTVEEGSLRFQMTGLRKALGSDGNNQNYIINVPGRGYCFTAPISRVDEATPAPILAGIQVARSVPLPRLPALIGRENEIAELAKLVSS